MNLSEFIKTVSISPAAKRELEALINNFAFALTFFAKYEEIWNKLKFRDTTSVVDSLKRTGWLLFVTAKGKPSPVKRLQCSF